MGWKARCRAFRARRPWTLKGVTIAEAPRRGRIYTTAPETFGPAIRGEQTQAEGARGPAVTTENYGRVSNTLRRDLRVAQVVCLAV